MNMPLVGGSDRTKVRQKRVMTDARKQQNRMAARKYRQRKKNARKQKLHNRSERSKSRQRQLRPCSDNQMNNDEGDGFSITYSGLLSFQEQNTEYVERDMARSCSWPFGSLQSNSILASNLSCSPASDEPNTIAGSELLVVPLLPHEQTESSDLVLMPYSSPSTAGDRNCSGGPALHSTSFIRETVSDVWKDRTFPIDSQSEELLGLSLHSSFRIGAVSTDHEQYELHPAKERNSSHCMRLPATSTGGELAQTFVPDLSSTGYNCSLPDLYGNYLQLPQTSILTACLYNALSIGINLQELMTTSYCSPFYRAGTEISDDPKALLAASCVTSVPKHLQPTLPQILFPHHACFDLIPFPRLRARAISLAASNPRLFNPLDLKKDMLQEGLVCWYRGSSSTRGSGQPWDMCAWEIAPWFQNKWRILLDGEDVQVWSQSVSMGGLLSMSE